MKMIYIFLMIFTVLGCKNESGNKTTVLHQPGSDSSLNWQMYKDPAEAGFSKPMLNSIKDYYEKSQLSSLFIVFRGNVLLALGDYQRRFQCHSVRKSLMNAVVGIGHDEGKIDLDKTLSDLHIDDIHGLSEKEKNATIRQILQSRSGVYHPAAYETPSMQRSKPVRYSQKSGSHWYYNNWDFNVLSTIVEQEMGDDFLQIFAKRIAKPIGMEDFREFDGHYYSDSLKSYHKAYAYKLSARDLARFGLLYLQKGIWHGERILSEEWIRESITSYSNTNTIRGGYGYLWWIPKISDSLNAFAACGVGTQVLLVIPELDLVIVQRVNTYQGNTYPFDPRLYKMIVNAKISPGIDKAELIPLAVSESQKDYRIQAAETFIGKYRARDGIYSVRKYKEGLIIEYPKGMRSLLIPMQDHGTFLVEDVLETIKLEISGSSEAGILTVIGL